MTIALYCNNHSPACRAVAVLIKHLNLMGQFNWKEIETGPTGTRSPDFLKINPAHTVPTMVEDNGAFILWESRAILQYVVNRFAPGNSLYPSDAKTRALVDRILFFDGCTFAPVIHLAYRTKNMDKKEPTEEMMNELKEKLDIVNKILGNQQFIVGNTVTIADISLAMCMPMLKQSFPNLVNTNLSAWFERIKVAVPEMKKVHDEVKDGILDCK